MISNLLVKACGHSEHLNGFSLVSDDESMMKFLIEKWMITDVIYHVVVNVRVEQNVFHIFDTCMVLEVWFPQSFR